MREIDLNLLPQLQALLEAKNVSRAAERRTMSQSAMSAALAKLRRHFNDELLVRVGRGYELTAFAEALAPRVEQAVASAQSALQLRSAFDPATSDRTFVIGASDFVTVVLLRHLRALLAEEAPGVNVDIIPSSQVSGGLDSFTHIDLFVAPTGFGFAFDGLTRHLFRDEFVVVVADDNELLRRDRVTIADLAARPQAVGDFGPGVMTPPQRLFQRASLTPRVAASVSGLQALPWLVESSDLFAIVPSMLARRAVAAAPISVIAFAPETEVPIVESIYWHPLQNEDPSNEWLRDIVNRSARRMEAAEQDVELPLHQVRVTSG